MNTTRVPWCCMRWRTSQTLLTIAHNLSAFYCDASVWSMFTRAVRSCSAITPMAEQTFWQPKLTAGTIQVLTATPGTCMNAHCSQCKASTCTDGMLAVHVATVTLFKAAG